MPQPNYRTEWICISTSGQAVDGRIIDPQWLIDAAETYSRNTYTAMIWPHHPQFDLGERAFTCNLGEVEALKTETQGDVVKLYAQLIPNQFLIDANSMGQKLFTSAEFVPDFAGSGKEYLFGLAVTDIPASLGTEKIKFVLAGEEKDAAQGNLETFSLGKLKTNKETSLWARLFNSRKDFTPTPQPNTDTNQPDNGEDEKKMDELKALLEKITEMLASMKEEASGDGDADTPEVAAEEVAAIADDIAEAAEEVAGLAEEVADNPEDEVKAQEFAVAKANLAKAMKAFNVKPGKPARRTRRTRREFSAKKAPASGSTDQMAALNETLSTVITKLSAMGGTKLPGSAPAGSKEPFEYL
jgi:hypothetical protein